MVGGLSQIFDMNDPEAAETGLSAAVEALRAGRLVGMPTETVYGLAADATSGAAVARVFAAKGRPRFNPLIAHVPSLADAETIGVFGAGSRRLAEAFWPGPLTLVVPLRRPSPVADLVTAGLDTIAIRVPAHPLARALIARLGRPVAAPSANRSGHVSPTTAAHVAADLDDAVAVILDAGPSTLGLESTIVGFDDAGPRLLRSGALPRAAIEACLGVPLGTASAGAAPVAPGMLASHYAPAARLRLNAADVRQGEGLLAFGSPPESADLAVMVRNLSETGDLVAAAANFFAALRELDTVAEVIAVMPVPEEGLGEAINDRLRRAAAPRP